MKAADYIAKYLELQGVTHVFELIGGMITFLLDSLQQETDISIVSMHHEQGAGFAAEGYGRITGIPGVAMATSGPGATNLLTAIGSCYFDSTPAVFITGQVNRHEQKGDRAVRQLGFQETDIVSMATPVTKGAWLVNDIDELPKLLEHAFALATSGRPGPVLLDIPMDVQRAQVADLTRLGPQEIAEVAPVNGQANPFIADLLNALKNAERPMILAGGGLRSGHAVEMFRRVVDRLKVPVVNSLMAVDVLPHSHPLHAGLIGSYGNRWANIALSESDVLLVLGSRLDVRQTGADTADFKGNRKIFHVDCEPGEMNNRVTGCHTHIAELKSFLHELDSHELPACERPAWTDRIQSLISQWPDTDELKNCQGINPNVLLRDIAGLAKNATAFVVDVGQHQMWAAQSLRLHENQRFLTSGGMGAMGFALPAAIGASLGSEKSQVVVVAGDGGFQLNIQELETVRRSQIPLKMIVLNNGCHGMVRQFQESYFKSRYQSTMWGYSAPSFAAVAGAYCISSSRVESIAELPTGLSRLFEHRDQPYLLEVLIHTMTNAYPKMAFGRPISQMEPLAVPLEMEGT